MVLRAALGIDLVFQGAMHFAQPAVYGFAALGCGVLLAIGYLTRVASLLAAVTIVTSLFFAVPGSLVDSGVSIALAAAISVAIFLLGPGAFSVDARLFGRREIIIPAMLRR